MRTLYLLRHAKSSWDNPHLVDHDRPLAPRGIRATRHVADHMREAGIAPQVVVCSSARRTRETVELLGDAVPTECDVHVEDGLYEATVDALLERLRALPASVDRAMLVGHNPALQHLALLLVGSGDRLGRMTRKFPTAALATLDASIEGWPDLTAGCAQLTGFMRPRDLEASW